MHVWLVSCPMTVIHLFALRSIPYRSPSLYSQVASGFNQWKALAGKWVMERRGKSGYLSLSSLSCDICGSDQVSSMALIPGGKPSHGSSSLLTTWILFLVATYHPVVPSTPAVVATSWGSQSLSWIIIPCLPSQVFPGLCNQFLLLNSLCLNHVGHLRTQN